MMTDNKFVRFSLSYDDKNRLTGMINHTKSPSDPTRLISRENKINYKDKSTIIMNTVVKINDSLLVDSIHYIIYHRKRIIHLELNEGYSGSLTLDEEGRLIKASSISQRGNTVLDYIYYPDGKLSGIKKDTRTFWADKKMSESIIYKYEYPVDNQYKNALENINTPQWLVQYLFSTLCPYLNNANQMKLDYYLDYFDSDETSHEQDTEELIYTYNEYNYPVEITSSNNSSPFVISYADAK